MKCDVCETKNLTKVAFHDVIGYKCNVCGCTLIQNLMFDDLVKQLLFDYNIGNTRKHFTDVLYDCSEREQYEIDKFKYEMTHVYVDSNLELIEKYDLRKCSCCNSRLIEGELSERFKIYYCNYCNSIYFIRDEFEEYMIWLQKKVKRSYKWHVIKQFFKRLFSRRTK